MKSLDYWIPRFPGFRPTGIFRILLKWQNQCKFWNILKCHFVIEIEKCSKWPFGKKQYYGLNLTNEFMLYLGRQIIFCTLPLKWVKRVETHATILLCDLFKCHIISCLIDFCVCKWMGKFTSALICFLQKSNISTTHWPYVFLSKWQEKGNRNPYQEYLIQCVPFSEWLEVDLSCNLFIVHDVISPINEYIDTSFVMFLKLIKN